MVLETPLKRAAGRKRFVSCGLCASGNVSKVCFEGGKEPFELGCCLLCSRQGAHCGFQKQPAAPWCVREEALVLSGVSSSPRWGATSSQWQTCAGSWGCLWLPAWLCHRCSCRCRSCEPMLYRRTCCWDGQVGKQLARCQENCVLIASVAATLCKWVSAMDWFRATGGLVEKWGKRKTTLTSEQPNSVLFCLLPLLNGKQTSICQPWAMYQRLPEHNKALHKHIISSSLNKTSCN